MSRRNPMLQAFRFSCTLFPHSQNPRCYLYLPLHAHLLFLSGNSSNAGLSFLVFFHAGNGFNAACCQRSLVTLAGSAVGCGWKPKERRCARSLNDTCWHASLEICEQRAVTGEPTRACSMSGEWMFFPEMSALMAQRMTYVVDVRNIYSQPRSPPRGCVAFAQESPLPSFLSSRGSIMNQEGLGGWWRPGPRKHQTPVVVVRVLLLCCGQLRCELMVACGHLNPSFLIFANTLCI